ncbi:MAG: DNA topoisomerase 3, partial [Clostridium sp.]|nr:DNA topoisomerase 3 [Clostridium sp.]
MSKTLILAEKPSVGKELARVLKCNQNKGSYIEGNKYIVTWAMGHLVGLMDPEGYDEKYKKWSMETLPMLPKNMKLTVLKKTGKQYNEVKKQLLRNDVSDIIVATDAGREGELVAYWILEKAKVNKPVKRLWISSQTEKAILEGFKNLKPGKEFENLRKAAVCRAEADWLVGLNVTRALTCKYNAQLSAGRVQSPTLAMIVNREEEIKNFKPVDYFNIKALGKGITLAWASDKGTIYEEDLAKSIVNKCKGQEGEVVEIIKSNKKKYSKALYDLTELQRDANKIWGYSAKQTLNIMQRLYENHKVLTYPRTDSRYITSDIVSTIPERLKAVSFGEYRAVSEMLLKSGVKANKNFVDNSKVSDHHAIIPTEQKGNLVNLSVEEKHIYDLVVKRFLSVMMKPYEYEQTSIKVNVNGEIFTAKGNIPKQKGWKVLYEKLDLDEEEKTQDLPQLNKGDKIKLLDVSYIKKQTEPPSRFNEATLLSAMENPQKYVNVGKDAAKTL